VTPARVLVVVVVVGWCAFLVWALAPYVLG
jgi:hypothetical protein